MFSFEILSRFLSHFKFRKQLLGESFSGNADNNNFKIISLNYFLFMGDLFFYFLMKDNEQYFAILFN